MTKYEKEVQLSSRSHNSKLETSNNTGKSLDEEKQRKK